MSYYEVKTAATQSHRGAMSGYARKLQSNLITVQNTRSNLGMRVKSSERINARIKNCIEELEREGISLRDLDRILGEALKLYNAAEKEGQLSANKLKTPIEAYFTSPQIFDYIKNIIGEFGDVGSAVSNIIGILALITGGTYTVKELISGLKGAFSTSKDIIKIFETYNKYKAGEKGIIDFFGLGAANLADGISQTAAWTEKLSGTFVDKLNPFEKMDSGVHIAQNGLKAAGWVLTVAGNAISNKEEYESGAISAGRAVAETVVESAIDIGTGIVVGAAVTAISATVGAPVVLVGGVACLGGMAINAVCEHAFGVGATELVSDAIIDTAENVGKAVGKAADAVGKFADKAAKSVGNAVSNAGKAVSGWFSKTFAFA